MDDTREQAYAARFDKVLDYMEADGDVFVPAPEMQFPPESHRDVGHRPFESGSIYTRAMCLKFDKKSLPISS